MTFQSLLPANQTPFEVSLEEACDFTELVSDGITEIAGIKYDRPLNTTVAPWLVYEYGLGPISAFFDNPENLIDQGRAWQKKRGTPSAVKQALSWVGCDPNDIAIEDAVRGRRRWHLWQMNMGRVPDDTEIAHLTAVEYLAGLSDPARAELFRAFYGYDIRGLGWSNKRWGRSMWGDSSGVRLPGGVTKWSFGRTHSINAAAAPGAAVALNVNYANGDPVHWYDPYTWETPGIGWGGVLNAGRLKSHLMRQKKAYIRFKTASGQVIGLSRVVKTPREIAINLVAQTCDVRYIVSTQFGDGEGAVAASAELVFGYTPDEGVAPGLLWVDASQNTATSGEIVAASAAFSHRFLATVRETIEFTITI